MSVRFEAFDGQNVTQTLSEAIAINWRRPSVGVFFVFSGFGLPFVSSNRPLSSSAFLHWEMTTMTLKPQKGCISCIEKKGESRLTTGQCRSTQMLVLHSAVKNTMCHGLYPQPRPAAIALHAYQFRLFPALHPGWYLSSNSYMWCWIICCPANILVRVYKY